MGKRRLTEDEVNRIDNMLRKLAMKRIFNGHLHANFEDVVSELWINALKIIDKEGKIDFNYIAKASMYKMVDMVRYNVNHEDMPIADGEFDRMVCEYDRNENPTNIGNGDAKRKIYTYSTSKPILADEMVDVMAILDLFQKGSKEYMYIEILMKIEGIIEIEDTSELPSSAIDSFIADFLGYAGCKSNGYGRLKKKVREVLKSNGYTL